MKGYKAFNKGLICKGKQYAENTVFEEDKAEICRRGMHFCENPLDVLDYYDLVDNDGNVPEFAEVEALDEPVTDDKKKFCTKKLRVGSKLTLSEFIKAAVKFIFENSKGENVDSGDCSQLASSGNCSQLASSGDCSQLASSGDSSQLASSGNCSQLASSGDSSKLASSGDYSKLASSGDYSQLASSGDCSKLASSGDYSKLASSGDYSKLASSGDYSKLASSGDCSVVAAIGRDSRAKGKKGNWLTLAEWEWDGSIEKYKLVCVKTEQVDGKRIKEDVFYILKNGEFTEV